MSNRLADETSPYLLQHAANPVDWQPWDARALDEARERDVPLLVSIGYAACHWCHVMEHESFSDPEVAAIMNSHFVCIKVDREERPDVDALFMEACQSLNGHGGWPLNAFATPDGKPFWVGTYFPPADSVRSPSWRTVLTGIAELWQGQRDDAVEAGDRIAVNLIGAARLQPADSIPGADSLDEALESLHGAHDRANGGFGGAPKFPPHEVNLFLLAAGEREIAIGNLAAIAAGGIHDQVGGGFCRYAVDATWTIPHFEKMLSDNALLAVEYLHAWQVGRDPRMLEVCRSTLEWMERELLGPDGGFFASLDADDPEGEGRFYSWTPATVAAALPDADDAEVACRAFGITAEGNFEEGLSVPVAADLTAAAGDRLERIRRSLLEARAERPRPATDTKVITAWNALAVSAFAQAGAALDDDRLTRIASDCANHLLADLRDGNGRLMRCRTAGRAVIPAVLEDHALLLAALIDLYEATFEPRWYAEAISLEAVTWERFGDAEGGGYFTTAVDAESLAVRRKDLEDHPIPSGQSTMALALLRLHGLSGEAVLLERADRVLLALGSVAARAPLAVGRLLRAILIRDTGLSEVALVGPGRDALLAEYRSRLRPTSVVAACDEPAEGMPPLLEGRGPIAGRAAAHVCRDFACREPVTEPEALAALLDGS